MTGSRNRSFGAESVILIIAGFLVGPGGYSVFMNRRDEVERSRLAAEVTSGRLDRTLALIHGKAKSPIDTAKGTLGHAIDNVKDKLKEVRRATEPR